MNQHHATTLVLLAAVSTLGSPQNSLAQQYQPGETYWGNNRYVEYIAGNTPLVLSAPHGGYLEPPNIPNRTWGTTVQDTYTQETARAIYEQIVARTGRYPHLIISHLHRTKLDPNGDLNEAAQGNPIAARAYHEFHKWVGTATSTAQGQWGKGHYIDIHGHGHPEDWIELGYGLTANQLALNNTQLNSPNYISASTLQAVVSAPNVSFPTVLRGTTSLGGLLQSRGYTTVPGPANPSPGAGNYFSGGYNIRVHSSRRGGSVDGTQLELPFSVRATASTRDQFARKLADSLSMLLTTHYNLNPSYNPRITITATDPHAHETGNLGAFTISRTGNLSNPVTVNFVVSGRATANVDYRGLGSQVVIPANQASVKLFVRPLDDSIAEGSETVNVRLTGNVGIGAPARATVVIADDERDPDLSAHWAMNSTSGAQVVDISGSGHHGTLRPSATAGPRRVTGKFFGGLDFDEVDDHVQIPRFSYSPSGGFTVSVWFSAPPTNHNQFQHLVSHGAFGQPNTVHLYLVELHGTLRASVNYNNALVNSTVLQSEQDLMDGQWHHAVLTASTENLVTLWVDGQPRAEAHLAGDSFRPSGDMLLGMLDAFSSSLAYRGRLDDVRIYQRALEPAEVSDLYSMVPPHVLGMGAGCTGTNGTPQLVTMGLPTIGNKFSMLVSGGRANSLVSLALGTSTSQWYGVSLPIDLTPFGAKSCSIRVAPTVLITDWTNAQGWLNVPLAVPNSTGLIGRSLFAQGWLFDPGVNNLGMTLTNGLDARIGGVK